MKLSLEEFIAEFYPNIKIESSEQLLKAFEENSEFRYNTYRRYGKQTFYSLYDEYKLKPSED